MLHPCIALFTSITFLKQTNCASSLSANLQSGVHIQFINTTHSFLISNMIKPCQFFIKLIEPHRKESKGSDLFALHLQNIFIPTGYRLRVVLWYNFLFHIGIIIFFFILLLSIKELFYNKRNFLL